MKKMLMVFVVIAMVLSLAACGGSSTPTPTAAPTAAPTQANNGTQTGLNLNFTLVNQTGSGIYGVYISSSGTTSWGDNLITGAVFPSGNEVPIVFTPGQASELWDIMVSDEDGTSIYFKSLNLSTTSKVTLTIVEGVGVAALA